MKLNTSEKRKLQKRESFKRLINLGLTAICIGLEVGVFAYCWMYHFRGSVVEGLQRLWFKGNMLEITIYGVVLFLLSSMYGGMRLGYLKNVEVIFSQVFSWCSWIRYPFCRSRAVSARGLSKSGLSKSLTLCQD